MSANPCKQKCEVSDAPARSLYVHVPFCRAKCRYCDFYSLPAAENLAGRYARAVQTERALRREELALPAETIFVGGGTPTALEPAALGTLLSEIRNPKSAMEFEFSIEANPGTVTAEVAGLLGPRGVNRVNLGVQSFLDAELALLGRIHCAADVPTAVGLLRAAGIGRLGLDLIYGIPGQTIQTWKGSLRRALDLGLGHLSCYALSFEPHTPLGEDLRAGRVVPMDEGLQKDCYFLAIELAGAAGLEPYEISNFAARGQRCRHNLVYWKNQPYLGLGPSAVSYVGGRRRKNEPDLLQYLEALEAGRLPASESECVSPRVAMAETAMLGLRMIEGLDRGEFLRRFGRDVAAAFPASIERYARQGALIVTDQAVRIAQAYLFAADTILADIVAEA